jgi:putative ABC transport system substrate-binding protein
MRRREFIAGLADAAAWPLAARAQQPKMPVIGYATQDRQARRIFDVVAFPPGLNKTPSAS